MKNRQRTFFRRLLAFWGSPTFFWMVVILLVVQAAWVALSNRYPMAFDEDYHFGIIRLYAHHLSPFWQSQPANADVYGAVFRDPSYLYHYFMSFPYRVIALLTHRQAVQVLWLRFINIGLFAASLLIYRRLFRVIGASEIVTNTCLLLFALIPVVSLLAAQINYDNLFIPLVALTMLWTVEFAQEVVAYKRISTYKLLRLLILCLLASLVKYAFLPFFVGAATFVLAIFWRSFKQVRKFGLSLLFGFTLMTKQQRVVMAVLTILVSGLFLQRYGVNMIRYHTPVPDCSQVLSVHECSAYGPWLRDYALAAQKPAVHHTVLDYMHEWLYGMWLRLFFTVDGPPTQYQTRGPLLLPAISAIAFTIASAVIVLRYSKQLWQRYHLTLGAPLLMAVLYIIVLWLDGYEAYLRTGQPVAINGRYLLPILPSLFLLAVLGWRHLLDKRYNLKITVALVAIICLAWGGGALTFVLRSSNDWYWQNAGMRRLNADVRQTIGPAVPGYGNPIQFLR